MAEYKIIPINSLTNLARIFPTIKRIRVEGGEVKTEVIEVQEVLFSQGPSRDREALQPTPELPPSSS